MDTPLNVNNYPDYRINRPWGFNAGGVTGVNPSTEVYTPAIETSSNVPSRAVDKLPKAQMVNYDEYLGGQAGYASGKSTWSLIG